MTIVCACLNLSKVNRCSCLVEPSQWHGVIVFSTSSEDPAILIGQKLFSADPNFERVFRFAAETSRIERDLPTSKMPTLAERAFIQEMMGYHALPSIEATRVFNRCLKNSGDVREVAEDELGDELEDANTMLRRYDFQLSAAVYDGVLWWGLVNTSRDEAVAKLSCAFTDSELPYFRAIGEKIGESEHGHYPLVQAQLLAKSFKMTVADGGRVIKRLSKALWLAVERKDGANIVKYGPRSVLELPDVRSWYRDRVKEELDEVDVEMSRGRKKSRAEDGQRPGRTRSQRVENEIEEAEEALKTRGRAKKRRTEEIEDMVEEMEIEETPRRSTRSRKNREDGEETPRRGRGRKNRVVEEEEEDEILPQEPSPSRSCVTRSATQEEAPPTRRFTRSQKVEEEEVASKRRRTRR